MRENDGHSFRKCNTLRILSKRVLRKLKQLVVDAAPEQRTQSIQVRASTCGTRDVNADASTRAGVPRQLHGQLHEGGARGGREHPAQSASESYMRAYPQPRQFLSLLVTICQLQGGVHEGVEAGGEGSVMH